MTIPNRWIRRQLANSLVILLIAPLAAGAASPPPQTLRAEQSETASSARDRLQESESKSTNTSTESATPESSAPGRPAATNSPLADKDAPAVTPQTAAEQTNQVPQPVGTAAAPYGKTSGVAASRPAGAVIAPAKQRRARSILIKVGVAVGAAVAIGTVVALTHESPSHPK
jgi:predicted component of type VI protein secretion system